MERAMRDGSVRDRVTIITDRQGIKDSKSEGLHFIRGILSIFQHYFPQMLQRIIIFPAGMMLWTLSKVIKPFLDKDVVEKIRVVNEDDIRKVLDETIVPESLPTRYGGMLADPFDAGGASAPNGAVDSAL
jgi:hypothetical protein